jgi:hypothetical protein
VGTSAPIISGISALKYLAMLVADLELVFAMMSCTISGSAPSKTVLMVEAIIPAWSRKCESNAACTSIADMTEPSLSTAPFWNAF